MISGVRSSRQIVPLRKFGSVACIGVQPCRAAPCPRACPQLTALSFMLVPILTLAYFQLFSKSFYGFTAFKLKLIGTEGILMASIWVILPFLILMFLLWLLPPWKRHADEV